MNTVLNVFTKEGVFVLHVYEKVTGGKCKVAVLDDNMRIILPVYEYLRWLKNDCDAEPNTVVAYAYDLKTYFEFLQFKGYNHLPFAPGMLAELRAYLREPYHHKNVYYLEKFSEKKSENPPKRKAGTINRILGTVYSFYTYLDWELNADKPMVRDPNILRETQLFTSVFRGFADHARREGKTVKSFFKVKNRQEDESDEDKIDDFRILSETEYKMILDSLGNKRDKLLFKFLYFSGVRISSATSLTIESIPRPDYNHKWTVAKIKEPKDTDRRQQLKSGSHKVFVPTELVEELDNYILEERIRMKLPHRFLFVALNKKDFGHILTREAIAQKYADIAKKLDIPHFTPHTMRHTCCTNLLAAGVSIHIAKKVMNHKNISTTMKYEHIGDKQVLKELDGYWDGLSIFIEREVAADE